MKALFAVLGLFLVTSYSFTSKAEERSLLTDSCITTAASTLANAWTIPELAPTATQQVTMRVPGINCQDMRSAKETFSMIRAVLLPASIAENVVGVGSEIAVSIAALDFQNPAVLGVTVLGASGITVVYIFLHQTAEECVKEDQEVFRLQVFRELQEKYGMNSPSAANIEYKMK